MRKFYLALFFVPLCVFAGENEDAPKAYRWVDKDGSVVFSNSAPPPGVKAQEIEVRDADTVIDSERSRKLLNDSKKIDSELDQRLKRRESIKSQIDSTKAELEIAKRKFSEGEAPQEGELQRLANGKTRLADSYHARRAAEADKIKKLEAIIDDLYEQLSKVR